LKTGPSIAAGMGVSATEPATRAEPAPGPAPVAKPVVESGARARAKAVGVKTAEVPATETAAEHGWATIEEPLRNPERHRVPRQGETSSVALRLTARASVMDRLLALRSSLDALRGASVDELAAAVETFGTGWSRRRALVAVLEVGLPTSLADALELVQRVGDEQTMIWALPVLAGRPGLTESDKASLVDVATGRPAVARRIAMRLAVSEHSPKSAETSS